MDTEVALPFAVVGGLEACAVRRVALATKFFLGCLDLGTVPAVDIACFQGYRCGFRDCVPLGINLYVLHERWLQLGLAEKVDCYVDSSVE